MVRAPTDKEYGQWKVALESQTADNTKATYVQPVFRSPPHATKVCYEFYYKLAPTLATLFPLSDCLLPSI